MRIGIYAGSFDPVHTGHLTFALQALQIADLDRVYFMPERRPRFKSGVEHYAHRLAMIKQVIKPHSKLKVLDLVDVCFTVDRTLTKLREIFKGQDIVFLFGSDAVTYINSWPNFESLVGNSELVIGLRDSDEREVVKNAVDSWKIEHKAVTIFSSFAPEVSSSKIRQALNRRQPGPGLLSSVERYSDRNWLYVSLDKVVGKQ